MSQSLLQTVLWPVLTLVLGYVAMLVAKLLLNANADINKLPAAAKQLIVALIAAVLAFLSGLLHIPLPGGLSGLDQQTVLSILTTVAALVLHNSAKVTQATAPPSAPGH